METEKEPAGEMALWSHKDQLLPARRSSTRPSAGLGAALTTGDYCHLTEGPRRQGSSWLRRSARAVVTEASRHRNHMTDCLMGSDET
ncbi:hypothetical protein E2C01_093500 [Portunus trituberculatus]|uniref:Uncharacterized protein n=1 Tax=Portunus trituberculatus TaxID=210409 RepID=A0A5B7JYF1_PORTR|nr:hypothetical protein [Portunus trituberculatus]